MPNELSAYSFNVKDWCTWMTQYLIQFKGAMPSQNFVKKPLWYAKQGYTEAQNPVCRGIIEKHN